MQVTPVVAAVDTVLGQIAPIAVNLAVVLVQVGTILMQRLLVAGRLVRAQITPVVATITHIPVHIAPIMANIVAIVTQVMPVLMHLLLIQRCIPFRRLGKRGEHQAEYGGCNDKAGFRHFGLPVFRYWMTAPQTAQAPLFVTPPGFNAAGGARLTGLVQAR